MMIHTDLNGNNVVTANPHYTMTKLEWDI